MITNNDPALRAEVPDPPPDKDTVQFLDINIPKVEAQKLKAKQFAATWLRGEGQFKYKPPGKTDDEPVLDLKSPFSPNPTVRGQTYIVARPEKKPGDPYTTHAEKFIWLEVKTV